MDVVAFLVQVLLLHSNIAEIILSISTCTSVMDEYFNVITLNFRYQPDPTYTFVGVEVEKYVKTILLDRFSEESNFRVNFTGELQKIIVRGENEKLCHNFNVPLGVCVIIGDRDCMSIQTVISTLKEQLLFMPLPQKQLCPLLLYQNQHDYKTAMTSTSTFETDLPPWAQSLLTSLLKFSPVLQLLLLGFISSLLKHKTKIL